VADRGRPTPQDIFGGRIRRAATPARLLAKGASAAALARARALRGDSAEDIAFDPRLVAAAEDMARSLGEMKGAAMKIGQALSFVDVSLIPEEYRTALSILQSDAPPMPFDQVEAVVEEELGAPIGELFDWFSPRAIAAASIGQVHMAHLSEATLRRGTRTTGRDGPVLSGRLADRRGSAGEREVVVKVQYPGVAKAVEADLRNAALLSGVARLGQRMLAGLAGDIDVKAVVDEVRDRIGDELDYRIEAANQQEFADRYRDDAQIGVPDVVFQRSSRRVLTTDYVDALRWSAALEQPEHLRDRWGQAIVRFAYGSVYDHGAINTDTHPGNYLFHEDGRVTFLDFGCVSRINPVQQARLRKLILAEVADDEDAVLAALVEAGLLRRADGFDTDVLLAPLRRALQPMHAPQPFRYTRELLAETIAESLKLRVGVDELKLLQRLEVPREYALLSRATVGVEAVLCHLEAAIDFDELFEGLFGADYRPPARSAPPDDATPTD
jgi:predicted unusual protein kinase regulating ubiquinone biosynthesis (AarF/ABC1/UbiB family)